jgi:chaperonin GroES
MKARPVLDRVLIKQDEAAKNVGAFVIPESSREKPRQGEVVAVGPGRMEDGKLIPVAVKDGDKVLFQWGDKVKIGEDEFYLVKESEILAIIK